MVLSSTLATPFLPETEPEPLAAGARRRRVWAALASLGLHLALLAALIAREPEDLPAQEAAGGTQALEIAYVSPDEINSIASEAAPAESPETPREDAAAPEPESAPAAFAAPAGEETPTVDTTAKPAPAKPAPVKPTTALRREAEDKPAHRAQPRREADKKAKPMARPKPSQQAGRGTERQQARAAAQGGAVGPAAEAGGANAQNWRGAVLAQLARHKQYPSLARDHHVTGTAIVAFTLTASGAVAGVSLARGSGSSALDQATLAMVRNAAPFPAAPAGARLSFKTAVTYNLR